ncbi:MAG: DUF2029 domain-containing protein [Blastochloris sp.]|nr:DUF2029 domain-containing protein [Blastochloris sp.]
MFVRSTTFKPGTSPWFTRLALALNISLAISFVGLWIIAAREGLFWRADFSAFYTGWSIVRDGRGAQLYDLNVQTAYQQLILEGRSFSEGLLPYVNPPHATIPFMPLAWLPLSAAFAVWTVLQLALLVYLLRLIGQLTESWQGSERRLIMTGVLAFPPLFNTLLLGTFSLAMLVCLLQFYLTLKRGDERFTALWLILATVKPQAVVLPGLMLLAARRFQALAYALMFGIVALSVSLLILGWQSVTGYLSVIQVISTYFGVYGLDPAAMYNVRGTLTLWLGNNQGQLINQISTVALLVAASVTVWLWRGPWRPDEPVSDLRVGLTVLLGLLCTPHLYAHDALLLVLPAMLFFSYLRQSGLSQRAYATFILSCPLLFLISEFTVGSSLGIRLPVVAMLVLLIWMLWALAQRQNVKRDT